ncbi:hypothetical protein WAI453_002968 [Rhynchosporium graminicola]
MAMLSPITQSPASASSKTFALDGTVSTVKGYDNEYEMEVLKDRNKEDKRLREKFPKISGEPTWLIRHIEALREQYSKDGWEYKIEIPQECRHRLYPSIISSYLIFTRDKKGRKGKVTKEYITIPLSNGASWGFWKPMDEYGRATTKISLEELLAQDAKKIQRAKELAATMELLRRQAEEEEEIPDSTGDASDKSSKEIPRGRVNSDISSGSSSSSKVSASTDHSFATRLTKTESQRESVMSLAANYAPDRALRSTTKLSGNDVGSNSMNTASSSRIGGEEKYTPKLRMMSKGVYVEIDDDEDEEEEDGHVDQDIIKGIDDIKVDDHDDEEDDDLVPNPKTSSRQRSRSENPRMSNLPDSDDEVLVFASKSARRGRRNSRHTQVPGSSDHEDEAPNFAVKLFSKQQRNSRSLTSSESSNEEEENKEINTLVPKLLKRRPGPSRKVIVSESSSDNKNDEVEDLPSPKSLRRLQSLSAAIQNSNFSDEEEEEEALANHFGIPSSLRKVRPSPAAAIADVGSGSASGNEAEDNDDEDDELPDFNTKSRYSKQSRPAVIEISDEEEYDASTEHTPENESFRGGKGRARNVIELEDSDDSDGSREGENIMGDEQMADEVHENEGVDKKAVYDDHYPRYDYRDLVLEPENVANHGSNQANGLNEHRAYPGNNTSSTLRRTIESDEHEVVLAQSAYGDDVMMGDADDDDGVEVQVEQEEWFDYTGFCRYCGFHQHECECIEGEERFAMVRDEDDGEDFEG